MSFSRYVVVFGYAPQNEDELELADGDFVKVVEKCDDGWFVGISERTGDFGTFPGNYVKEISWFVRGPTDPPMQGGGDWEMMMLCI